MPAPHRRFALGNPRTVLRMERLEARDVPSVTLRTPPDTELPTNHPLFLPVTTTSSPANPITITAASDNSAVTTRVLSNQQSLKLDITGTDVNGAAFSGSLTVQLFNDVAPLAVQRIKDLVASGYYNGKLFHRVIDNFVIQGGSPNGDGIGGSTLPDFQDEFNKDYTFASQGILALANAGDDNNNAQFFITAIDRTLTQRPEYLNFNHTIFGLLTSGFETYTKIIKTTKDSSDKPTKPVTITNASIITDNANGVIEVIPGAGAAGNANITVTVNDGTTPTTETIPLKLTADTTNSRAFLNPVTNPTVPATSGGTFQLTATDLENDQLTYAVGGPTGLTSTPANGTATVDASGKVTFTPNAGFTGTQELLVGVRDQTNRGSALSDASNFDTQKITVTVATPTSSSISVAVSQASVQPGASVVVTGTVTASKAAGSVEFFADGTSVGKSNTDSSGAARLTTSFATAGKRAITASFTPSDGTVTSSTTASSTALDVSTSAPATVKLAATGAASGSAPRVTVTNADGTQRFSFLAYDQSFTGGVRVATADVTGDGQDDIVTVPGFGGSPLIHIYNGTDGTLVRELMVFEDSFRGGLYLSLGDAQNKGYSQILVGAGFTGGPRVTLFNNVTNKVVLNYFAYDPSLRSGVSVSLSDLSGNGTQQILTGPGTGGGPQVKVFKPQVADTVSVPSDAGSFFAGDSKSRAGIRVGAGGVVNNTRPILVGPFTPDSAPLDQSFDPVANGVFIS